RQVCWSAIGVGHHRGEPDIRIECETLEPWPHHAEDREALVVERDQPADDARISTEAGHPHAVADDDDWIRVGNAVLVWREDAADLRTGAQHREIRCRYHL